MKKINKTTIFGLLFQSILLSSLIFPDLYKNTTMFIIGTIGIIVFGTLFVRNLLKDDKARKAKSKIL